jgi:F-type H+-transporting ATPase subunit delta
MSKESVAPTYAQALLELAVESGALEEVRGEVAYLSRLLDEDRDLRIFFENPRVEKSAKRGVVEACLRGKLTDPVVNLVELMLRKGRQLELKAALGVFEDLYAKHVGLVRAEAVTAVAMSGEAIDALRSRMSEQLARRVDVTNRVEPEILGGLIVRFDGRVADGSFRTAIAEVRSSLTHLKFTSELVHEN